MRLVSSAKLVSRDLMLASSNSFALTSRVHTSPPDITAAVEAWVPLARYSFHLRLMAENSSKWLPILSDGERNNTPPGFNA